MQVRDLIAELQRFEPTEEVCIEVSLDTKGRQQTDFFEDGDGGTAIAEPHCVVFENNGWMVRQPRIVIKAIENLRPTDNL